MILSRVSSSAFCSLFCRFLQASPTAWTFSSSIWALRPSQRALKRACSSTRSSRLLSASSLSRARRASWKLARSLWGEKTKKKADEEDREGWLADEDGENTRRQRAFGKRGKGTDGWSVLAGRLHWAFEEESRLWVWLPLVFHGEQLHKQLHSITKALLIPPTQWQKLWLLPALESQPDHSLNLTLGCSEERSRGLRRCRTGEKKRSWLLLSESFNQILIKSAPRETEIWLSGFLETQC